MTLAETVHLRESGSPLAAATEPAAEPARDATADHAAVTPQRGGTVRFERVSKVFATAAGPVAALGEVSLSVEPGEIYGIIGRSGAGKSTLIRLINGLERPTGGAILVDGTDVSRLATRQLAGLRRRIGMIFQHFNLMSSQTVEANVALPLRFAGVPRREATARALAMLDLVGLKDKRHAYPSRLSGGQKQRVGIARALVSRPDILLCDEATSALDPETTRSILALLKDINRRLGITIILITHEMEVIRDICDRVAVIERGAIVETGAVWQVFGDPRHPTTRSLLRREPIPGPSGPSGPSGPDPGGRAATDTDDWVFHIDLTGAEGSDPDLFALARAVGPDARLIAAGIERIQGRAQGRLSLRVPRTALARPDAALERLRAAAPHARIALEPYAESPRET